MKNTVILQSIFVVMFAILSVSAKAQQENKGTLTVSISGFKNNNGHVVVNIFRKGDDIMGKPFIQKKADIASLKSEAGITDLAYGTYAIFAFHDENENSTLDHNWLNIPSEPFGYSNNWNFGLFTGMPTFEKTKVTFAENNNKILIKVK